MGNTVGKWNKTFKCSKNDLVIPSKEKAKENRRGSELVLWNTSARNLATVTDILEQKYWTRYEAA